MTPSTLTLNTPTCQGDNYYMHIQGDNYYMHIQGDKNVPNTNVLGVTVQSNLSICQSVNLSICQLAGWSADLQISLHNLPIIQESV